MNDADLVARLRDHASKQWGGSHVQQDMLAAAAAIERCQVEIQQERACTRSVLAAVSHPKRVEDTPT